MRVNLRVIIMLRLPIGLQTLIRTFVCFRIWVLWVSFQIIAEKTISELLEEQKFWRILNKILPILKLSALKGFRCKFSPKCEWRIEIETKLSLKDILKLSLMRNSKQNLVIRKISLKESSSNCHKSEYPIDCHDKTQIKIWLLQQQKKH